MPDASELDKIARADVDLRDGDLIEVVDAGAFVQFKQPDGSTRERLQIGVRCAEGQEKLLTLNNTSREAMMKGYGKMSESWVGLQALVTVVNQNVGKELKRIVYISPVKNTAPKSKHGEAI